METVTHPVENVGKKPLAELLRSIAILDQGLDSLPAPDEPGYYPALAETLADALPGFYAAYDGYVAAALAADRRRVTCSGACSACCRHYVSSVEPFELVAIHSQVKSRPDYPDILIASHRNTMVYESIASEEENGETANDRALYRYYKRGRPCPFLEKDDMCGIYETRPMACRMFYSEASPRFCAGEAIASPWNRNFQVELPAVAEEALARCARRLEHLDFPEDLFPGLLAANERFGRYDNETTNTE